MALDLLQALWLVRKEFIHGFVATRPGRIIVLIQQYNGPRIQPRIEEFKTLFVGRDSLSFRGRGPGCGVVLFKRGTVRADTRAVLDVNCQESMGEIPAAHALTHF